MPNIENIDRLITWIEADKAKFKMMFWANNPISQPHDQVADVKPNDCETVFCLAGHIWIDTEMAKGRKLTDIQFPHGYNIFIERGAEYLGIDNKDAHDLFLMQNDDARRAFDRLPDDERADMAIAMLEKVKKGESPDWNSVFEYVHEDEDDEDL